MIAAAARTSGTRLPDASSLVAGRLSLEPLRVRSPARAPAASAAIATRAGTRHASLRAAAVFVADFPLPAALPRGRPLRAGALRRRGVGFGNPAAQTHDAMARTVIQLVVRLRTVGSLWGIDTV